MNNTTTTMDLANATVIEVTDNPHSHLDRCNFNTDVGKSSVAISFYTYYNETSPVYYELMPFVQMLKFVKNVDIINSVPRDWVKTSGSLNDKLFSQYQIPPDTLFGEFSAVHFIITASDSKIRVEFIEKLSELCFRKIDSQRVQRLHLRNKRLTEKLEMLRMKQEKHSTILDVLRDGLKIISQHHTELENVLHKLFDKV